MLPILIEAASLIREQDRTVSFILPVAPTLDATAMSELVHRSELPVRIVTGDTYGAIQACDLALAVSGTVTLETAILGAPMIVIYRMSRLSYLLARALIHVPYVGMPNVIAGRSIVPELLQDEATADRISKEALSLLREPRRLEQQKRELSTIADSLGQPGVADRVAWLVLDLI
jgi:lipid-A-disaccharide synthase